MRNKVQLIVASLLATSIAACSSAPHATTTQQVIEAPAAASGIGAGYIAPLTALEHATALFNTEIFTATVVAIGEPIRAVGVGDDHLFSAIVYTPVDVQVTQTFKGKAQPDAVVRLRYLGGTAEGFTFDSTEFPELATVDQGQEILVFGGAIERAGGELESALTPNLVMVDQKGVFHAPGLNGLGAQTVDREELLQVLATDK